MAFWKKLNQTNDIRVLKDELVFDVTPTVNSTNPVTSDGIARAIAGASGEVPVVTENDNGKILTAIYDEGGPAVEWGAAPSELPAVAGNAGKILAVNSGATGVEWADAQGTEYEPGKGITLTTVFGEKFINVTNPVPSYVSGDAGKVLKVNSIGTGTEWVESWAKYKAGNGIAISQSKEISAVGGTGITVTGPSTSSGNLYAPTRTNGSSVYMLAPLTTDLVSMIETGGLNVVPGIDLTCSGVEPTVGLYASICTIDDFNIITTTQRLVLGQVNLSVTHTQVPDPEDPEYYFDYYTAASTNATLVYDINDLNSTLSKTLTWADVKASPSSYAIGLLFFKTETLCKPGYYDTGASSEAFNTGVYTTVTPGTITVTNPVPSYAAGDAGKVLTVNSGATGTEWTNFTQIEVVQSLPASPTSGVLYIVTGA